MANKLIYLDNAATTRVYDEVADIMDENLRENFYNPSAFYKPSIAVERDLDNARKSLAKLLGFNTNELYFTSGATESNNTIIHGVVEQSREPFNIVASSIEHPSIMEVLNYYKNKGVDVRLIPVNEEGKLDIDWLRNNIDENTKLVTVMGVNNEIGTIMDLRDVTDTVRQNAPNALLHFDFVQAFLKDKHPDLDLSKLKPDAVSITAHKIHGPKGIGALAIRNNKKVKPLLYGGGQERKFRSGTENTAGILGFAKAAEILNNKLDKNINHLTELKNYFIENIETNLDDITINTPEKSIPGFICLSINGIRAEVLLHMLEMKNILISAGSACSTHKKESYVHNALGFDKGRSDSSIRISLDETTTKEDIDVLIDEIVKGAKQIRMLTGYKK